jgi:CCR4-NOT transcription complex subunit 1
MRAVNALVPYLAQVTLTRLTEGVSIHARVSPAATVAASVGTGASEIFRALVFELDAEGRYALLATAASHLRYPNAHTLFFIKLLTAVFVEADAVVREQVVRAVTERLCSAKPHPWGLLECWAEIVRAAGGRAGFAAFLGGNADVERVLDALLRLVGA